MAVRTDTVQTDETESVRPARSFGIPIAGAVAIAWVAVLIVTGSPAADVAGWLLAVVAGIAAPGWVLVRCSRRAVAPLIEDVSWSVVAGCLVALLGWFLDRTLPWSPGPLVVGPVVVAVAMVVPAARRRILAPPVPGWGTGPNLALGGITLVALGWMTTTGLLAYRPAPGPHGTAYYPDVLYQLTLLGELRHHLVPSYSPVDGTALSYHWFLYAITAHLDTHTGGIGAFDSTLRLAPATLVPAIIVLIAVVARRMSGRVWAGPVAAALLAVVGISEASRWTSEDGSQDILVRIWRASPPQTMGWFAAIALAGVLFAFLRRGPDDRAVPVWLLGPLLVLTAGSKSSELPMLIAGIGLAGLVALIRRQWPVFKRCVLAVVLGLGVFEAASLTIYGGSSYGVKVQLFGIARARMFETFPHVARKVSSLYLSGMHYPKVALLSAAAMFLLPLLPRLLGVIFQVRYRPGDPTGWVCLGTAVAGLTLPFLLRHPAGSEIYFLESAYPIGLIGAASGLTLAGERARRWLRTPVQRRRFGYTCAALVLAGGLSAAVVANLQPRFTPLQRWVVAHPSEPPRAARAALGRLVLSWWTPTLSLAVVLIALSGGAAVLTRLVRRRNPEPAKAGTSARRAPLGWLCVLSLLLGTGLFTTTLSFGGTDNPHQGSAQTVQLSAAQLERGGLLPVTRDMVAAGQYVDTHAGAGDVVATNLYCRYTRVARLARRAHCDSRNFTAAALTQRHSLVGGWAYADRVVGSAWTLKVAYRDTLFWDRHLFAQQYDAFAHPSRQLLDQLYRQRHVRWIFVGLQDRPVDTAGLNRVAVPVFAAATAGVWKLRAPA